MKTAGSIPAPRTSMKTIYEDENVMVYDKPDGINADDIPMRAHRLDKDTSGVLIAAKNEKALEFLQKQFSAAAESFGGQEGQVQKKYIALVVGKVKNECGVIETFLARSPKDKRKQKAYLTPESLGSKRARKAVTEYKALRRFQEYTLLEVTPRTGRKHQIRAHMVYLGHPIAGDKLYGFKNQPCPKELSRQFLHASWLKIRLPDGAMKKFAAPLPKDLKNVISYLRNNL